jgi:hypothetical protein
MCTMSTGKGCGVEVGTAVIWERSGRDPSSIRNLLAQIGADAA